MLTTTIKFHYPTNSYQSYQRGTCHLDWIEATLCSCLVDSLLQPKILWTFQMPRTYGVKDKHNHTLKVMKYSKSPLTLIFRSPHISVRINFNTHLDLFSFIENDLLVIFVSKHDAHTSKVWIVKYDKWPFLTNLSILFKLLWPSLRCQSLMICYSILCYVSHTF